MTLGTGPKPKPCCHSACLRGLLCMRTRRTPGRGTAAAPGGGRGDTEPETPSPSPRPRPQPPGAAMAPPARCWGDAKGPGLRWPPGVRRHAPGPASAPAAAPSFAASMADRSLVHTKRVNVAPAMHSTACKCHSDGGGSASSWGTRPAGRSGWGDAPCTPCGSVQPPCPTEPSAPFRWQHKSWQRKEKKTQKWHQDEGKTGRR